MADFPAFYAEPREPDEDYSTNILIYSDRVDAGVCSDEDDDDSYDRLPSHLTSTSPTGADVMNSPLFSSEIPHKEEKEKYSYVPFRTGADVIENFDSMFSRPEESPNDVFHDDKKPFVYSACKASSAVKHFILMRDQVDALGGEGDATDVVPPCVSGQPTCMPGQRPRILARDLRARRARLRTVISVEEEYRYDMDHPQRGCFIIFNQETFDEYNKSHPSEKPLLDRKGTDKDAYNLEDAVRNLGFEHVKILKDKRRPEILRFVRALGLANHEEYDCFGCAILTHGGDGDVLYARDQKMKLTDFTQPFCADVCPSLAEKPKLFFIQACRGVKLDRGKKIQVTGRCCDTVDGPTPIADDETDGKLMKEIIIPSEADFLIANSTVPDYYAWRNETNGSWFIQSLCAVFKRFGRKMELMRMMTRVNKQVAYEYQSSAENERYHEKKQIPSCATRLTAEVFFHPKKPKPVQPQQPTASNQSTTVIYQTRTEAHTANSDLIQEESLTTVTANVNYPVDDFELSPNQDSNFPFPSPKNLTRTNSRSPAPSNPAHCPRSNFDQLPGPSTPMSRSIPRTGVARKVISPQEEQNHSLKIHKSATEASMASSSHLGTPPRSRLHFHRCSVHDVEHGRKKNIRQTDI